MKILELLERTTEYFAKQGLASPRLQIELLLAHVLDLPRMQLYLQFERILTPAELDALRPLVKRRAEHEPLQYLTGRTAFLGLTLECRPGVSPRVSRGSTPAMSIALTTSSRRSITRVIIQR